MKLRTQAARATAYSLLRGGLAIAAVLLVAGGGYLGVRTLVKAREASSLQTQRNAQSHRIDEVRKELARAENMKTPVAPSDLSSVQRLQGALEQSCAEVGCAVSEFRSSAEVLPFLTRFAKATTVKDWSQIGAQAVVLGKPTDVMAAVGKLGESDVAFEFDSLEIARDKVGPSGEATVRATINLRVLIRGTGRA